MSQDSDKFFWHRYTEFYEDFFKNNVFDAIFEFGVFKGDSIRLWRNRFPNARIVGADILPTRSEWPQDPMISYEQIDQGKDAEISAMLERLKIKYDLILEDGSHIPEHQARCLTLALPYVKPGGFYILEDIHTSHPAHPESIKNPKAGNALKVLLAIHHAHEIGRTIDIEFCKDLAYHGFFTAHEIYEISLQISRIVFYRRAKLPLKCYACGSQDFSYVDLRCRCGVEIFKDSDSMTCVIRKR